MYAFPNDFRSAITSRSLLLKARPLLVGAQRLAAYLTRVAFGTALVGVAKLWLILCLKFRPWIYMACFWWGAVVAPSPASNTVPI